MQKLTVCGFVGIDLLPHTLDKHHRLVLLKSLRNYVEDRMENEFDVWVNLAVLMAAPLTFTL